jgi:hypothetical protein
VVSLFAVFTFTLFTQFLLTKTDFFHPKFQNDKQPNHKKIKTSLSADTKIERVAAAAVGVKGLLSLLFTTHISSFLHTPSIDSLSTFSPAATLVFYVPEKIAELECGRKVNKILFFFLCPPPST